MRKLEDELEELENQTVREIEEQFLLEDMKRQLESILIKYLKKYERKQLRMNPVFLNIRLILEEEKEISIRQFSSIFKFLEREPHFRPLSKKKIFEYFSPIIARNKEPKDTDQFKHFSKVVSYK